MLFALGGIVSLAAAIGHLFVGDIPECFRSLAVACALGGVALWSWRIAESFEAFAEALR